LFGAIAFNCYTPATRTIVERLAHRRTGGTGRLQNLQAALVISVSAVKSNYDGINQRMGPKEIDLQVRRNELMHPTALRDAAGSTRAGEGEPQDD
jgi:hypothetical protein